MFSLAILASFFLALFFCVTLSREQELSQHVLEFKGVTPFADMAAHNVGELVFAPLPSGNVAFTLSFPVPPHYHRKHQQQQAQQQAQQQTEPSHSSLQLAEFEKNMLFGAPPPGFPFSAANGVNSAAAGAASSADAEPDNAGVPTFDSDFDD